MENFSFIPLLDNLTRDLIQIAKDLNIPVLLFLLLLIINYYLFIIIIIINYIYYLYIYYFKITAPLQLQREHRARVQTAVQFRRQQHQPHRFRRSNNKILHTP